MRTALTIILLVATALGNARAQQLVWSRNYGDTTSADGFMLAAARDGGYVAVGSTDVMGLPSRGYMLRIAADGTKMWDSLGGSELLLRWVLPRCDGGYFVIGTPQGPGLVVLQVDSALHVESSVAHGDNRDIFGFGRARSTSDGGFVVCGAHREDTASGIGSVNIMRFDARGDLMWHRRYRSSMLSGATAIRQLSDGGFAVVGTSLPDLHMEMAVMRLTADGDSLWSVDVGTNAYDNGSDVVEAADGGLIVIGSANIGFDYLSIFWLSPTGGDVIRDTMYGLDYPSRVAPAPGGGFIALFEESPSKLVRFRDDGSIVWSHTASYFSPGVVRDFLALPDGRIPVIGAYYAYGTRAALLMEAPSSILDGATQQSELLDLR
jgi:hypothetical protein